MVRRSLARLGGAALLLAALPGLGCYGSGDAPPAKDPPVVVADPTVPLDLPGPLSAAFHLDVYQVAVPLGAVSSSDDFWRRLDEDAFGPATRDLMLKNGIRVGVGATEEWEYFKSLIERYPHVARSGSAAATGTGEVELVMRQNVPLQDVFVIDRANEWAGRTYDYCSDLFLMKFWPNPRRPGEMRISVSPLVRSLRTRLEYTAKNEERYFREVTPEFLYELNLQTTIPAERFMVVGLSELGDRRTSLGHQFLTLDGGADKLEQALIFVPRLPSRRTPAATQAAPNVDAGGRE